MKHWTDDNGIRWTSWDGAAEIETSRVDEWVAECVSQVKAGYHSYGSACGNRSVRAAWHWEDGDIVIEIMQPILTGRIAWNRPPGLTPPEER